MRLKDKTINGAKWNTVATANNAVVQMLKLFVLARFLCKADFGLIAIATMVIGFTDIFANMGFSVGIIHKKEISKEEYSSVFWVNLAVSLILFGIICSITHLLSIYYSQPELNKIIPLLGLQLVITAFGKIFQTLRTKELDFKFISIVNMSGVYVGALFTIFTAIAGWGVYSMVFGMLLQTTVIFATYAIAGIRNNGILFHCNLREISGLIKIGGYQMGAQVMDYCSSKADIFLIGRFFGMEALGVYNLGKELLMKVMVVNPIITSVTMPAFAKIQDNIPLMRSSYSKILDFLSSINFPVFAVFFIFAEPLTFFLYGENMMAVAFFIRLFSVWTLFHSVGNPAGILMVSLGRTDLSFRWTVLRVVCVISTTLALCYTSIEVLTYAQVALEILFFFLYWRMMVYKLVRMTLREYVNSVAFPFLACVAAALPCLILLLLTHNHYIQIGNACVFALAYGAIFFIFRRDFLKELWSMVFHKKNQEDNE